MLGISTSRVETRSNDVDSIVNVSSIAEYADEMMAREGRNYHMNFEG